MHILYAQFANKKERDQMWSFLSDIDLSLWQHSEDGTVVLQKGEDLGFATRIGGGLIGIHSEKMPQKAWALMAWIAKRSSVVVENWSVLRLDDEEIPVVVSEDLHDKDILFVNEDGILNSWIERDMPLGPSHQIQRQFLVALSRRYDEKKKK